MVEDWVDYITLDTAQNGYKALNKMWAGQPVLLRGTPLVSVLVGRWSLQQLVRAATAAADSPKLRPLTVLCSDARRCRFMEYEELKNVYGSYYHVREPETQRLEMTFPEFVQCTQRWQSRRLLLKAKVMGHQAAPATGEAGAALPDPDRLVPSGRPRVAEEARAWFGRQMQQELEGGVDWEWLEGMQRAQRFGPVLSVEVEAGGANSLLPARYSTRDRLLAQVTGRQRVLLLSPQQAFSGLYPYPLHHTYDGYSMVDLEAVDPGLWPKFSQVRGRTAILQPGDVLFVPQYWFVHAQHLEAENVSLCFQLQQGARAPARDSAELRLSRHIEERVADFEGVQDVRHWLQLIGHGEEGEWIDLGTVRGYNRIVFCQSVRDDVDATLGQGEWARLLPALCQGRLVPTEWLNKDFREPLYLLDKPVWVEDTRSEEERKYPELFRHKLRAEGWNVPEAKSTVPIPGYNMPKDADWRRI
ncbi:hypothetical protein N2152v2_005859 [Parachlorella kessleri]